MTGDPEEAIDRARRHLRNAAREGLEAGRALVDAALLAGNMLGSSDSTRPGGLAGEVQAALNAWIETLESDKPLRMPTAFAEPLQRALQTEIDRWEKRSAEDESARPVLRAFLGLRELLWEIGMRGDPNVGGRRKRASDAQAAPAKPAKSSRQRVQRFDLDD